MTSSPPVVDPSGTRDSQPFTLKLPEEVVEHKWTIPNFLPVIIAARDNRRASLSSLGRFPFLIGTNPANPWLQWPLRAEVSLHCYKFITKYSFGIPYKKMVYLVLNLIDRPLLPLCSVIINFEFLKFISDRDGTSVVKDANYTLHGFNGSNSDFVSSLFDSSLSEDLVDKEGALHFHFKLKVNITRPGHAQPPSIVSYDFQSSESEVLGDLDRMFDDSTTSDFQVKVTGKETKTFHCHKVILAARSPMFREMFASKMKGSQENVVEVDDISPKVMDHFLYFLYSGRFKYSSWIKSLPELLYAADKYDVKSLKDLCEAHLTMVVTCKNAVALAKLSERFRLTKGLSDIKKFIALNVEKVTFESSNESEKDED